MKSIEVGPRRIGPDEPVFVISEIGANFDSVATAKKMIDASAKAGCDAVKIQTFVAETIARPGATFEFEDGSTVPQYDFWKSHEISREAHIEIKRYTEEKGMVFFSTPSYFDDVDMLEELGVELHKLGSDDLTNIPFLEYVARTGKPMIVSTGMCTLPEIADAVDAILATGNDKLILLHCLSGYPAPFQDANVRVIETLKSAFGVLIGFSDHTLGNLASILAVSLGAVAIEKHFTLDRSPGGPDNDTSVEPHEMANLVSDVRSVRVVLGSSVKRIHSGEKKWRDAGRKSIVASKDLLAGTVLTPELVTVKRPSGGLHPKWIPMVVGRTLKAPVQKDDYILSEHLA